MLLVLNHYLPLQGTTCDVRKGEDVKDLVAFAQENLKYIDIWVFCSDIQSRLFYLFYVGYTLCYDYSLG